jgi:hypothetical protein
MKPARALTSSAAFTIYQSTFTKGDNMTSKTVPQPIKPTFNAEGVPAFKVGVYQVVDLEPTNGTPPYSCQVSQGNLPAGLSFSNEGKLSGTAQTPNDTNPPTVWFKVTDSLNASGTRAYTISVIA